MVLTSANSVFLTDLKQACEAGGAAPLLKLFKQ